jgi:anti-sigma B factor antagonist
MVEITPEPKASLIVEYIDEPAAAVMRLIGELDTSTVDKAREAIQAIPNTSEGGLVFDVAEVTFMDSAGLSLLLAGLKRFGQVRLRRPPPLVSEVIEMTGLTAFLPLE